MKKKRCGAAFAAALLAFALLLSGCGGGKKGEEAGRPDGQESVQDTDGSAGDGQDEAESAGDGQDETGSTGDGQDETGSAGDGQDETGSTGDGQDETGSAGDGQDEAGSAGDAPESGTDVEALKERMGFTVEGSTLLDANGNPFVMRGINHAHTWFADQLGKALKAISETGSNTVRIVLSDGGQWTRTDADTVADIIAICKNLGMIAVLEVHDATGKNDVDSLLTAAEYFTEIKDALIGQEAYVIINIANEWGGDWNSERWYEGYSQAIPMLREAGLAHTIMVDSCGWGQYGACIGDYGEELLACDVLGNTMFSVHMYGTAGGTEQTIDENMGYALDKNLCLVIGEFGYNHSDGDVQEDYIMARCEERSVGYLAWSWKGNGGGVEYLDLALDWGGNTLSADWGEVVVNGENGIRATAVPCTVFETE